MAYRQGDAEIDTDYENFNHETNSYSGLVIALPHSCDQWVIGTADDARTLISDLEQLIPELENKP